MLKILHLADMHLDSRFSGVPMSEAAKRMQQLRNVFSDALSLAKSEGCSVVLISGDLFDSEYYTADTLEFLRDSFASAPDIRFIIAPGNHDPYGQATPYRLGAFPENVYVFDSEELTSFDFPELGLSVYGYAFTSAVYSKNPLEGKAPLDSSRYNVLCAHTALETGTSPYAPMSARDIADFGIDYAALGHIHTSPEIGKAGMTVYAFSGCIAGRDHSEYGEKGGIIVTLDEKDGKKEVTAERVRLCPWVYRTEQLDVTGVSDGDALTALIKEKIDALDKTEGVEYIIRLRLTGEIKCDISPEALTEELRDRGVAEIVNETVSYFGLEELMKDYSLRGEFFRTLKPGLESEDAEERRIAQMALKLGIAALNGFELEI